MSRVFDDTINGGQYISTPSSSVYNNLTTETIAFWVYVTDYGTSPGSGTLFVKDPNVSQTPFIPFTDNAGSISAYFSDFSAGAITVDGVVPLNTWTHVAVTYEGVTTGNVRIFINGTEAGYTSQYSGTYSNDDSALGFFFNMSSVFPGFSGFSGDMAEVAVWNVVLTPIEIASLVASTTGAAAILPSSLVGYWHLCGTVSPEPDATGNGNVGTLSNPPATQGPNSPGYNCGGPGPSPTLPYSVPDCRDYATFPNDAVEVNTTETYTIQQFESRKAGAPKDSRSAGAPLASGTYPQNSRTPGTFGPGE